MSWISELEYTFCYTCPEDHVTHITTKEDSEVMREKEVPCETCGKSTKYSGFEPQKVGITTEVEYEKNGRKAVAIRDKDGNMSYVSKTKRHYQKTGRVENQYTEDYKEKLQKQQQEQMLRGDARRGKGKVAQASAQKHMEEMVKNLPDGEYLSDGKEVVAKTGN